MDTLTPPYVNQPLAERLLTLAADESVPIAHRTAFAQFLKVSRPTHYSLCSVAEKTGRHPVVLYADGVPTRDYAHFFRNIQSGAEKDFAQRLGLPQCTWNSYTRNQSFPQPQRLEEMAERAGFDYAFLVQRNTQSQEIVRPTRVDMSDLYQIFCKVFS